MMISGVVNTPASSMAAQQVRAAAMVSRTSSNTPAATVREEIKMPEKSAINLPSEIMDLLDTQIAYSSDLAVFETGAEFWDMLTVAVDADRDENSESERP